VQKAIAKVAAAPMRATHSDRSEMVNQLLIGELAEIITIKDQWVNLNKSSDLYEGWVNRNELFIPNSVEESIKLEDFLTHCEVFAEEPTIAYHTQTQEKAIYLIPGSYVVQRQLGNQNEYRFPFGTYRSFNNLATFKKPIHTETAKQFLGVAYLWGGLSTFGIDCSGFTQIVARLHGIQLERDASQQAKKATEINDTQLLEKAHSGDLIFFNPGVNKLISHVGIYLGNGLMIHASGCVKINAIIPEMATDQFPYEKKYGKSICAWRKWI
jgi:hypothetical protein